MYLLQIQVPMLNHAILEELMKFVALNFQDSYLVKLDSAALANNFNSDNHDAPWGNIIATCNYFACKYNVQVAKFSRLEVYFAHKLTKQFFLKKNSASLGSVNFPYGIEWNVMVVFALTKTNFMYIIFN